MKIVLVTGGARAGKSRWAEQEAARLAGDEVVYIATAEPRDQEMASRIADHRASRPSSWGTLEAPRLVPEVLATAPGSLVLLDCLTLWISNLLLETPGHDPRPVHERVDALLETARARDGTLVVVTNEVGLGIVPEHVLARVYRDLLGWANMRIASEAERVVLLVSGIPVRIR